MERRVKGFSLLLVALATGLAVFGCATDPMSGLRFACDPRSESPCSSGYVCVPVEPGDPSKGECFPEGEVPDHGVSGDPSPDGGGDPGIDVAGDEAGGPDGSGEDAPDPGEDPGVSCDPKDHLNCDGDSLYWFDSCDGRRDKVKDCANGCAEGGCLCVAIGDAAPCDDSLDCTTDSCDPLGDCNHVLTEGSCLIEGKCHDNDQMNPDDGCQVCSVATATSSWSDALDGTSCGVDRMCQGGQCVMAPVCGSMTCPPLPGYRVSCNAQSHCEYSVADAGGADRWNVWILVPPGTFSMGAPASELDSRDDERPLHQVTFTRGFLIGKYPVTVQQYEECEAASPLACTPPNTEDWSGYGWGTNRSTNQRSAHPQNGLTWDQAGAVCAWMGGRRPSEAEWEYAASGPVHRRYVWGDSPDPSCDNDTALFKNGGTWEFNGCGTGGTGAVGERNAGIAWSGALDMAGNVWEWVEDWYHEDYVEAPIDERAWTIPTGNGRGLRGGGFRTVATNLRTSSRSNYSPGVRSADYGARCVRDLPIQCGDITCPTIGGYKVTCNAQARCEYANPDISGWKQHDVWIHIPPGWFPMGAPEGETEALDHERRDHPVTFKKGYLIGKYPVTAAQYEACMAEAPSQCTGPDVGDWDPTKWGTNTSAKGRSDHPQNGLDWAQAGAVCAWLKGRRPSESEWEYAATGRTHRKYPWGDAPEPTCGSRLAHFREDVDLTTADYGCGTGGTAGVGEMTAGVSWSGAFDMAGNIYEWCEDTYHPNYDGAPADGSAWIASDLEEQRVRVRRSAGYNGRVISLRTSYRSKAPNNERAANNGARCIRELP